MAIYIDDRELVAAHRAGDAEAFTELVREHRRALQQQPHLAKVHACAFSSRPKKIAMRSVG